MYRQARLLGVLLLVQVVAMVGTGVWLFTRFDWDRALRITSGSGKFDVQTVEGPWLEPLVRALLFAVYFLGPVILTNLMASASCCSDAGDGCWPRWRRPDHDGLPVLLRRLAPVVRLPHHCYSIFMILFLNSRRAGCGPPQTANTDGGLDRDRTWRMRRRGREDRRGTAAPIRARDPIHQGRMVLPDGLRALRRRLQPLGGASGRGRRLRGSGRRAHPWRDSPSSRMTPPPEPYTTSRSPTPKKRRTGVAGGAALAHEPRLAGGDFPGRQGPLARVGYISRLADALFSLTLLARGRVPGGAWRGTRPVRPFHGGETTLGSHGNVVRQDGWIVLRYWLFYVPTTGGATYSAPTTTG